MQIMYAVGIVFSFKVTDHIRVTQDELSFGGIKCAYTIYQTDKEFKGSLIDVNYSIEVG